MQSAEPLWVFGYGSLMWNPGFAYAEKVPARLASWRRSFCMWSVHYRGTPEAPGLVLALDGADDGECAGVAFRLEPETAEASLDYLRARELVTDAYREMSLPVRTEDGRAVTAITYAIDRDHAQYCAGLTLDEQAEIIARASGQSGTNADYLWNTVAHLAELGLTDPELQWLAERVRMIKGF